MLGFANLITNKDILAIKFMTQTACFCKSSFPGVNDAQMSYKSAT
jgi:hypothetical protein